MTSLMPLDRSRLRPRSLTRKVVVASGVMLLASSLYASSGQPQNPKQPTAQPPRGASLAQRIFTPVETREWILTTQIFLPAAEPRISIPEQLRDPDGKPARPAPGEASPPPPPTPVTIKPPRRPAQFVFRSPGPWVIYSTGQYGPRLPSGIPGRGGPSPTTYSAARQDHYAYSRAKRPRPDVKGEYRPDKPGNLNIPAMGKFTWDEGVVFTPAGITTSQHTPLAAMDASLWLDSKEYSVQAPPIREQLQSGARYFEFLFEKFATPTAIRLETNQPYRASENRFNEQLASTIRWHTDATPWPAEFKTALEPVILNEFLEGLEGGQPDPIAAEAAISRKEITALIAKWTQGKDLRSLTPIMAAKFITGKVIETFSPKSRAQIGDDGGPIYGFDVQTMPELITGSIPRQEDVPAILASCLRAAGFPARTVYGLDVRRHQGVTDRSLRAAPIGKAPGTRVWTEFALFDPETKQGIWIPIDIIEQRSTSSKAPDLNRPWPWFGASEDSAYTVPIAFHLLPPLPAMTFGEPNFVSYFFEPMIPAGRVALIFNVREPTSVERETNFRKP